MTRCGYCGEGKDPVKETATKWQCNDCEQWNVSEGSDMTGRVKRYVVFAYGTYYPAGGWSDHVGSYDTVEEAREEARRQLEELRNDWTDIIDLYTGENCDD